jgi:hypothetical protein
MVAIKNPAGSEKLSIFNFEVNYEKKNYLCVIN